MEEIQSYRLQFLINNFHVAGKVLWSFCNLSCKDYVQPVFVQEVIIRQLVINYSLRTRKGSRLGQCLSQTMGI